MDIHIGLNETQRQAIAQVLQAQLSDTVTLYIKTRNYHWNVTGPHFQELHKLFQEQYEQLDEILDNLAERIRQLGISSIGSMRDFLAHTQLSEADASRKPWQAMVGDLLDDHQKLIVSLRSRITETNDSHGDVGTGDLLTGIIQDHEKMAWILRSLIS